MAEIAQQLEQRRSRWRLAWEALRGRTGAVARVAETDQSVSFPELVWAHFERQRELEQGVHDGEWETEYRRRLLRFKAEHGEVREAYWCRYEASGVALTEKHLPRSITNVLGRDTVLRFHTATDWRTSNAPKIASCLHMWETAAIKSSEVLRSSSERIALSWILNASTRLLAAVDRREGLDADATRDVVREHERDLAALTDYYMRAGHNSARLVYFRGMIWGTAALAALVGGGFLLAWALQWLDPGDPSTYTLFATLATGALGAILSVMTRMAREKGWVIDFEVGRKSVRYLGAIRPWIGAMFALALYLALRSSLLELLQGAKHTVYFYATVGFAAGFSERRAKVLLDGVLAPGGGGKDDDAAKGGDG